MGRQINFFLHRYDQEEFDKLLKSFGEVVLLPYYHFDNKISTVTDTLIRDVRKEGTRVYLLRPQDFSDVKLHHIEKFNYWLVDDNSLPVLHFDWIAKDKPTDKHFYITTRGTRNLQNLDLTFLKLNQKNYEHYQRL